MQALSTHCHTTANWCWNPYHSCHQSPLVHTEETENRVKGHQPPLISTEHGRKGAEHSLDFGEDGGWAIIAIDENGCWWDPTHLVQLLISSCHWECRLITHNMIHCCYSCCHGYSYIPNPTLLLPLVSWLHTQIWLPELYIATTTTTLPQMI